MIHREDIDNQLETAAFNFFYRFSRFEFALKENGRVQAGYKNIAHADWNGFISDSEESYQLCDAAEELLQYPPDIQRVTTTSAWKWVPLEFDTEKSALFNVVLAIKAIRNNLFHGGKHSAAGWDQPERVRFLLDRGNRVLDTFAKISGYDADYWRKY